MKKTDLCEKIGFSTNTLGEESVGLREKSCQKYDFCD
jgi:hypothetical protein